MFDIAEVKHFIQETSIDTKIYIGCDSERFKDKDGVTQVRYFTVVVCHIDGNKGCKVFGDMTIERDIDDNEAKPFHRMMTEVYKSSGMFLELEDVISPREFEIHLDINDDIMYGSSVALQQAIGYVKGVCGVEPQIKPNSPAASFAADRMGKF
jgi:predicted RNase H-related nuclease YkuK (DUF458 family)